MHVIYYDKLCFIVGYKLNMFVIPGRCRHMTDSVDMQSAWEEMHICEQRWSILPKLMCKGKTDE